MISPRKRTASGQEYRITVIGFGKDGVVHHIPFGDLQVHLRVKSLCFQTCFEEILEKVSISPVAVFDGLDGGVALEDCCTKKASHDEYLKSMLLEIVDDSF